MKVVVITGCNRGVGEGIMNVYLENGYKVYGINRTKSECTHENYIDILCDITNQEDVKKLLSFKIPKSIDVLILNAGIRRFGNVSEELSVSDWNLSINTNLNGAFYVLDALIPNIKNKKGDIFIIGSHSEKYNFEGGAAYCSSKLALKGLTNCLMEELRYHDVRISYLSLGSIKNRDHGYNEEWKLKPTEVGKTVYELSKLPKNVLIPYLDVRPIKPLKDDKNGLEKLQYV